MVLFLGKMVHVVDGILYVGHEAVNELPVLFDKKLGLIKYG